MQHGFKDKSQLKPEPIPKEMLEEALVEWQNPTHFTERHDMIHA